MTEHILQLNDRPLDFAKTLHRYRAYGYDAANAFDGNVFRKVARISQELFLLEMRESEDVITWRIFPDTHDKHVIQTAEKLIAHILGLHFDLPAFYAAIATDGKLNHLCQQCYGFRPPLSIDPFEALVTSISAQQINLQFAFTVRSRLVQAFGDALRFENNTYFAFPTPAQLAVISPDQLRALQFTNRKAEYIVGLAREINSGRLDLTAFDTLPDHEIEQRLCALRGIGKWTVEWFLARCLGRGTAFPAGDLGVRKAVQNVYFNDEKKTESEIRECAARWGEHANLACHYLLTALY